MTFLIILIDFLRALGDIIINVVSKGLGFYNLCIVRSETKEMIHVALLPKSPFTYL